LHQGRGEHPVNREDADAPQWRGVLGRHNSFSYMGKWSSNGWIVLFFVVCVQCPRLDHRLRL
jgi:hypothetical protein